VIKKNCFTGIDMISKVEYEEQKLMFRNYENVAAEVKQHRASEISTSETRLIFIMTYLHCHLNRSIRNTDRVLLQSEITRWTLIQPARLV
jgi:hypothetical protein